MAVENKYVDANLAAGKKGSALTTYGTGFTGMVATVAVAVADDDLSVYRLWKAVPSALVPIKITIHNTAITGGTDYDIGLYETITDSSAGTVVDKDILADGISMGTARAFAVDNNAGLTTIAIANGAQTLGELSAQTDVDPSYDIAITANTVGTAAGTIRATAWFAYK